MKLEQSAKLPAESYIEAVTNPFIEHWSFIRCGSYTSEWVARAIGLKPIPANFTLRGPVWFDLFRPVIPSDMRKLFKAHGITTIEERLGELSDEERLYWIKNEVATKKRPPTLLIRTKTLHWIAIGGYDDLKRVFYIYDSRFGSDSLNTKLPIGNAEMSYEEVLDRWRGRWFMYYVAIVVTNVQARDLKKEKINAIVDAYTRGELVYRSDGVDAETSPSQTEGREAST